MVGFRIKYTNGGTGQASFLLQVDLKINGTISTKLDAHIEGDEDVSLNRSIVAGQQPDGEFRNDPANGVAISTTSTLTSGSAFTSAWIDTHGYNSIETFITADVVSAIDGIEFEFTDDLAVETVRETKKYTYKDFAVDRGFMNIFIQPKMVGFRVKYTNGSTGQAAFLLQADLKNNGDAASYNNGDALIVGDFKTEVALGNVPNYDIDNKFGFLQLSDIGDVRTVWSFGDDTLVPRLDRKVFPSSAAALYIVSDSASDTSKQVTVTYHDASNVQQTTEVTLNGQTGVQVAASAIDCDIAYLSGDDQTLIGNVYIMQGNDITSGVPNDETDVVAFIRIGFGRTQQATIRVPANTKMVVSNVYIAATRANGSSGSARVNLRLKPSGESWYILRPYLVTTTQAINKVEQMTFNEGDCVEFYISNISDNDTSTNVFFEYQFISTA